ncbi:nibrin-like [Sycon ciliatum]|uniref:nibrin-like n=1 Tax=Sycon ciliatum TaxID=27933 RepID=UPI0031F5F7B5
MWFLNQELDTVDEAAAESVPSRVPLLVGKQYTIGRRDASILLQGDQSISRLHATVNVVAQVGDKPAHILLVDHSKFGTFVDDVRIPRKTPTHVADGSLIKFGMVKNLFRVQQSMIVTTSNMTGEAKAAVTKAVAGLGGRSVPRWSPMCDFLIMSGVTVTIKVVEALAACKPIVVPEYFQTFDSCAENCQRCPNPTDYLPSVSDESLKDLDKVAFAVKYSRRTLFKDKTFFFLTERQYAELKQAVHLAGGKAILMKSKPADGNLSVLVADNACVLLPRTKEAWGLEVSNFLEQHGLRGVESSELGFALVYNKVQSYANPKAPPTVNSQYSQSHRGNSQAVRQTSRVSASQSLATTAAMGTTALPPPSQSLAMPRPVVADQQPSLSQDRITSQVPTTVATDTAAGGRLKTKAVESKANVSATSATMSKPAAQPRIDTVATHNVQQRSPRKQEDVAKTSPVPSPVSSPCKVATPVKPGTSRHDNVAVKPEPATPTPFQHGKRSHRSTVQDSPDNEPKSKRARPSSPVRAVRSRRTRDVSPESLSSSPPPAQPSAGDTKPKVEGSASTAAAQPGYGLSQSQASYVGGGDRTSKFTAQIEVHDDLPKNLMLTHTASLVSRKTTVRSNEHNDSTAAAAAGRAINFKKFRKMWPLTGTLPPMHARMPRIIGGEELFVHTSAFRELDEFLMQEQEANAEMRRQDEFAAELFRSDSVKGKQQQQRRGRR